MSRKAKILLAISGLFTLSTGLSGVFVNIFLWRKSSDFIIVAIYNLMHYIFVPVTFILAGWLSKKKNGIWSLRLGIALFAAFFCLILFINNNVVKYVYPLGILFGIASGFYWLAFHVLSFDFTSSDNRDTFNGYNGSIAGASGAAAPFIGAYVIGRFKNTSGYTIVFAVSLCLFVILILVSLIVKSKNYGHKLNYKKVFTNNFKDWSNLRKGTASWGMRDVVIAFLVSILIFSTTKSEMSVGKLSLLAALVSSGSCMVQQKIIKPEKRMISLYTGSIFMLLSVIGMAIKVNLATLLIYILTDAVFVPFFTIPMSSAGFNIIDDNDEEDYRIEYVVNKEIALNAGRILSTVILIALLAIIKYERMLNYFLLFIGCAQLISIYFFRKLRVLQP